MRGLLRGAAVAATLLTAGASQATPVIYTFSSGQVTLTATLVGSPVILPIIVPLSGVSVVVDTGALTLNSFNFTIGTTGVVPFLSAIGTYTGLNIDFASATASGGTLTLIPPVANPQEYGYSIGPVLVSGQIDAIGLPPINNAPFGFSNPTASGSIFIDTVLNGGTLDLDGITIGAITVPTLGGPKTVVIKGDFQFEGIVPEPGTALLLGSGLVGLAMSSRRRR